MREKRLFSRPTIYERKNVTRPQTFQEDAQTNEHQKQRNIPCDLRQTEKKKKTFILASENINRGKGYSGTNVQRE